MFRFGVRALFLVAFVYLVIAGVLAWIEAWTPARQFSIAAVLLVVAAAALQIIHHLIERNETNGRHRKAVEAHRAGTGGSTGDSSRSSAGGGTVGAGAGMSAKKKCDRLTPVPPANFYDNQRAAMEALVKRQMRMALGGVVGTPSPTSSGRRAGEFDGNQVDFAAGVVTGTRSFAVDKLGRLTGVAYATVWKPGENEARCMTRPDGGFTFLIGNGLVEPEPVRPSDRPPHSIADCAHGFYGYYEGSNDYYEPGRVMGVVEAYGQTIIGSRGFRASKARIVALHIPSEISYGTRRSITRNYPLVPIFESFEAMVAEFPPDDAGHGVTPDNDPDFWTRKA